MEPARVALDVQALQEGSGVGADRRRRISERAGRLAREGRLAAALIAPEKPAPAPAGLPPELLGTGASLLRWDCRAEARRLAAANPSLVHMVPAPLLHVRSDEPGGMVASPHWSDSGVPRVVVIDADDARRMAADTGRLSARLGWIRASDAVELEGPVDPSDLGLDPSRLGHPRDQRIPLGPRDETARRPHLATRVALMGPFPPGGGGIGAYNARVVTAMSASAGVDAVTTTGMGWRPPPGVGLVHAESWGTDVRPSSYDSVVYALGNSDGHLATVEAALRHPGWLWLHEARLAAVATTALGPLDDNAFRAHMGRLLERAYPGRAPVAAAGTAGRSHLALADAGVGLTEPLVERAAGVFVNSEAARHALVLDLAPLAWRPPIVVLPPACPPVRRRRPAGAPAPDDTVAAFGVVSMGKRPDLLVDAAAWAGCRLAFVGPCPDFLRMFIEQRAVSLGIGDRVEVVGSVDDQEWWAWMDRTAVAVQLRDSRAGEMSAAVLDALAAGVPVLTNLASARDYPAGTVELLHDPDPAPAVVAAAVGRLLAVAARREELTAAGQAFAASHQPEDLAAAILVHVAPAASA